MSTIKDYLRWRGDLTFDERPANVVDNVVFATLAYVDLRATGAASAPLTLGRALAEVLAAAPDGDVAPYIRSMAALDAELLELAASSARFGGVRLHDYVDEVDAGRALQFSAVTFDVSDVLSVVAYRGTDHSLTGWRENFMLSFQVTRAQERAAAYLERAVRRAAASGRRVVVCGHSKGGNLAAYAAAACPAELRAHIERVWSDDGPGLAEEVVPTGVIDALGATLVHVVPEYSVVGMLFAPAREHGIVVRSEASGILQHDPTTWEVGATDVVRAPALSGESRLVAEAFSSWLADVDLPMRQTFTGELFDVLAAGDPERIDAALASPAAVQRVLAASAGTSAATREVVRKLLGTLTSAATDAAASAMDRAAASAATAVRELAEGLPRRPARPR